jgi:glucose-6-phosphate isomerase
MIDYSLLQNVAELRENLQELESQSVIHRIWENDHTVWSPDPSEITNRLGWLDVPHRMDKERSRLKAMSESLREDGIGQVVLLGMGGSSLAPDVFQRMFGNKSGYPALNILDTTHPDSIQKIASELNLDRTAFIVATKSGTTVETLSLFRYFYARIAKALGEDRAGKHFIAITDPESPLLQVAERLGFRDVFVNDPNIGGRYSALSYFGLVPAALIGVDIKELLSSAARMSNSCMPSAGIVQNQGAVLGTILGIFANLGRDKLTFISSPEIAPVGDWIEQLIAESTGKNGKGILPVLGEDLGDPEIYGSDRIFVHLQWQDDNSQQAQIKVLSKVGHPVVTIQLEDLSELGAVFFMWELATAVAGYWLGINPFDQPNVESAKRRAKEMVAAFLEDGKLPAEKPWLDSEAVELYVGAPGVSSSEVQLSGDSIEDSLFSFLRSGKQGAYISLQAYLPLSEKLDIVLREFQTAVRDATGQAVTLGYGPRFLHSTGQLHKGDAGRGLFVQLTGVKNAQVAIPDGPGSEESSIKFNTLIDAQALGDRRALLDADRAVVRIHLKQDIVKVIQALSEHIAKV